MKFSSPSKFNAQINDEASAWFVEFRTGDVEIADRKRFNAWLRTSPEHLRAYLELAVIWNDGSRLDPKHRFDVPELAGQALAQTNIIPLEPDARADVLPRPPSGEGQGAGSSYSSSSLPSGEGGQRPGEGPLHPLSPWERARVRASLPLALAASILIAVGIGIGAWLYTQRNVYSTGIGEQRSLGLEDGSTIELNAHSKIRVRFTADRRTIDLVEGQALFHVAKDTTRPFIVQSDDTTVRAVGTEFDVYRRTTGTTVTVLEGRVAVSPPSHSSLLPSGEGQGEGSLHPPAPGERASSSPPPPGADQSVHAAQDNRKVPDESLNPFHEAQAEDTRSGGAEVGSAQPEGDGPVASPGEFLLAAGEQAILTAQATVKPAQPNVAAATAWTRRRLVLEAATLAEVAEEFNRYNHRRLVIQSPELADFRITGVFASTDPGALIRFLQGRPGIAVTERKDEILITRKP